VELKQLVTTKTKQHLRCRIGIDAPSRSIGDEDGVSRPAEQRTEVIVNCGDGLGAQSSAPGLTLLLVELWYLIIATTVSMQGWAGQEHSGSAAPVAHIGIVGEDPMTILPCVLSNGTRWAS
jgi:hypothetical protein